MPPRAGERASGGARNPPEVGREVLRPAGGPLPPDANCPAAPSLSVPGLPAAAAARLASPSPASLVSFMDAGLQTSFPDRVLSAQRLWIYRGCLTPTVELASFRVPGNPASTPCYLHKHLLRASWMPRLVLGDLVGEGQAWPPPWRCGRTLR